jgi:hypothetical protein
MIYAFESSCGEEVTHGFPVEQAPRIGDQVVIPGHGLCTRVASFVLDGAGIHRKTHQYPYVSHRLPSTTKGVDLVRTRNGRMKPLIKSRKHEEEVMAKNDLQRDGEGV